ncbi:protein REVEILLE 1-like [Phalaenopsis equestris]|uniref:protein REVEILLE 1-like n=1 Tax=Phalaenopsis equestris TaxID=78828 RepID=UPI0009E47882|nr:protein REVEILLE 1-like [Phalaenopsis equestris]
MAEAVGVLQGQNGCTSLNSLNGILTKYRVSYGDQIGMAPKLRKPYTITKQRERWSQDEHKKFLEAVQLHGRAWRRIEEHIGTKTAVQIRSHAQKFISKMARGANDNQTSNIKPVEIPPPRPKKKPTHPYPRKQVLSSPVEVPVLGRLERTLSPILSISEQDKSLSSPQSVVGSESINPFFSNNHESRIPLFNNSVEEDIKHLSLSFARAGRATKNESTMELKMNTSIEQIDSKEASSGESVVKTLKLFGTTLIVTNSCKQFSTIALKPKLVEEVTNETFPMNGTWPGGFIPAYFYWPALYGNEANSEMEPRVLPLPGCLSM